MSYDQEAFLEAVRSPNGMKRLSAVLGTLSLEEVEMFAGEISENLGKLLYNDERAERERVQVLVAGIAKFAADPELRGAE